MHHLGTLRLETGRLILRPFTADDAPAAFRNWTGDPAVTEFLTWPAHPDVEVTRHILAGWAGRYANPDYYQWALELKSLGEPVGSIAVVWSRDEGPVRIATLGYCLGKAWWGQELMPEALRAVIGFLFDRVGYTCIQARHDVRNPKSGRVMAKAGMTRVGVLRRAGVNNRGVVDEVLYDMLPDDPRP